MNGILRGPVYVYVFLALAFLTFMTVACAFVNLGWVNLLTALSFAVLKASLIAFFFMHIGRMKMLIRLFAAVGFFWLFIMLFFAFSDYISRGWMSVPSFWQ